MFDAMAELLVLFFFLLTAWYWRLGRLRLEQYTAASTAGRGLEGHRKTPSSPPPPCDLTPLDLNYVSRD